MKIAVSSTTLASYDQMNGAGFGALQSLILARMKPGQLYSRRQLAQMTRLETSTVAGRVNELISRDVLEVVGTIKCPVTQRNVEAVKRTDVQMALFS